MHVVSGRLDSLIQCQTAAPNGMQGLMRQETWPISHALEHKQIPAYLRVSVILHVATAVKEADTKRLECPGCRSQCCQQLVVAGNVVQRNILQYNSCAEQLRHRPGTSRPLDCILGFPASKTAPSQRIQ